MINWVIIINTQIQYRNLNEGDTIEPTTVSTATCLCFVSSKNITQGDFTLVVLGYEIICFLVNSLYQNSEYCHSTYKCLKPQINICRVDDGYVTQIRDVYNETREVVGGWLVSLTKVGWWLAEDAL